MFQIDYHVEGGPRLIFKVPEGGTAFNFQGPGGGTALNFRCPFGKISGPLPPARNFWMLPNMCRMCIYVRTGDIIETIPMINEWLDYPDNTIFPKPKMRCSFMFGRSAS